MKYFSYINLVCYGIGGIVFGILAYLIYEEPSIPMFSEISISVFLIFSLLFLLSTREFRNIIKKRGN